MLAEIQRARPELLVAPGLSADGGPWRRGEYRVDLQTSAGFRSHTDANLFHDRQSVAVVLGPGSAGARARA